jgi:hypothetical protein
MEKRVHYLVNFDHKTYGDVDYIRTDEKRANCVGSLLVDGRHAPAIDIDLPCRLVPSTTLGCFHLYIDHPTSWFRYRVMLWAMWKAGFVQKGYYKVSVKRKNTFLRMPGVKKKVGDREGSM